MPCEARPRRLLGTKRSSTDDGAKRDHIAKHVNIESELIEAQRAAIIDMRERGEIDNVVLRRLQQNLDLTASRSVLNVEDGT